MTKKKKILLVVAAVLIAALIGIGVYFGIEAYEESLIRFHIDDTLPDGQGKKATVILMGGQSNASGASRDDYLQKNVSVDQYAEYANGYDNVFINYYVSDNNLSEGFVKCAAQQGESGGYFGPELGLAEKLNELYPDEMFFIIKCTWSGTNLCEQWLSPSSLGKTGPLYKQFVKYAKTSLEYLTRKNYDISITGMCWMQGESDASTEKKAMGYEKALHNFIKDIRNQFAGYAAADGIAFIDAYIADNPAYWVYCDLVNQAKQTVAATSSMNVVIDTVAEGLTCSQEPEGAPDIAHYDSMSQIKLGHLFAKELVKFFD